MFPIVYNLIRNAKALPEMRRKRTIAVDSRDSALEYSYLEILTAACVDMVRSDGKTDADELEFLREVLGLSQGEAENLIKTQGFVHYRRVFSFLTERQKEELLAVLLECAGSGRMDQAEAVFLTRTVETLGLPEPLRAKALKRINALSKTSS